MEPIDLGRLAVLPLACRKNLTAWNQVVINPSASPPPVSGANAALIDHCAQALRTARRRGCTTMLIYGAHLLRNGATPLVERMLAGGWLTHLATNGAGTIHDWEYAWFGASTESVAENVISGTFGVWDETATNIHRALMAGALDGLGYGSSLGRYITEDGATLPSVDELRSAISRNPDDRLTSPRATLLQAMLQRGWPAGRHEISHRFPQASMVAAAYRHGRPMTVHPGIGYDIISNHPVFSGAALGHAAELDFKLFGGSVANLEGGVVLSVGSAIMGPQVFEKSVSCVNNLRLQAGQKPLSNFDIFVVDIQDGGGWDWRVGEPPKTNPAYYLRFCKSYSRMGGTMHYLQCDNAAFVHRLYAALCE